MHYLQARPELILMRIKIQMNILMKRQLRPAGAPLLSGLAPRSERPVIGLNLQRQIHDCLKECEGASCRLRGGSWMSNPRGHTKLQEKNKSRQVSSSDQVSI